MSGKESDSGHGSEPEEGLLHKRLIRLPMALWDALDADAVECRRSSQKQLEAILTAFYRLGRVDIGDMESLREAVSPHLEKGDQGDPRKGRAFLERVMKQMEEEESKGSEGAQKGKRKSGNG